jgi:hypothetical protein
MNLKAWDNKVAAYGLPFRRQVAGGTPQKHFCRLKPASLPRYVSDPQEWFTDERLYAANDPAPWTHSEVKRPVPVGVGMPPFPCCVTVRGERNNTAAIFERFAVSAAIVFTGNGRIGHFFTFEATEDEFGTNVTIHEMFDEQRGRPVQCASRRAHRELRRLARQRPDRHSKKTFVTTPARKAAILPARLLGRAGFVF